MYRLLNVTYWYLVLWFAAIAAALSSPSALASQGTREQFDIQLASLIDEEKRPRLPSVLYREASKSSWALAIDNDVLTPGHRDQDYTYGFDFTYSGSEAAEVWLSVDDLLGKVDSLLNVEKFFRKDVSDHSIEVGLFGFTPEDISITEANANDRPYASLIYVSNTRERMDLTNNVALKTTLTVGVLGLDFVGNLQNRAHDLVDGDDAKGWGNQISDGGEVTARYAVARQHYLGTVFDNTNIGNTVFGNTELKSTLQASIGYITEASWSLSIRSGEYQTRWSTFNPELASYGEKSTYTTSSSAIREHYFWAGLAFKARAYNAFLQGQFRDSAVTYSRNELNPILLEAWLGYTIAVAGGYRFSYVLRGHSSEIKRGAGNRGLVWGGLILAKTFE